MVHNFGRRYDASSPTTGIVSTSALGIGEYYILGNEAPYTITWDGTTGNWGFCSLDSFYCSNFCRRHVLILRSATITLNVGSTSVNKLSVTGGTLTLNLSSNTLTVNDNYSQSGGTLSTSTVQLISKRIYNYFRTYSATSGTSQFSASANSQNISGATFYNLILTGGSSGSFVKNLIAGNSFTVSNDFTIQTTAEIS